MDDAAGPAPVRRTGGTVEPVRQATTAAGRPKFTTQDPPGREYELYDPFAGVKHRAKTFDEMVVKAERVRAIQFTALDADGTRTSVHKVDDQWQVPAPRPLLPALDPATAVDLRPRSPARDAGAGSAVGAREAGNGPVEADISSTKAPRLAADRSADKTADAREHVSEVARLQASLHERYLIKRSLLAVGDVKAGHTEYRFRGDSTRIAFTESNARLATDTNSPSVARSMVDVAQAREWKGLRISGVEEFRRMVWIEATVRGLRTTGYEPVPGDLDLLRKAREARLVNRVDALPDLAREKDPTAGPPATAAKQSARGGGGRKAVLAALEAVMVDRKVPKAQRDAVMSAATQSLARRTAAGEVHKVKVYDKAAPSQRPMTVPAPEQQHSRDRSQPAPAPAR